MPRAQWEVKTVYADDVLSLEGKARGGSSHIDDGMDTFIVRDGKIRVQTVRYTVQAGFNSSNLTTCSVNSSFGTNGTDGTNTEFTCSGYSQSTSGATSFNVAVTNS